jgi:hypothetical protein
MGSRDKVIEIIKQYSGVTVSSDKVRYVDLLGPDEAQAMQKYFCDPATSGCALTIRGVWRKAGISDKRLNPNYVFGKAVSWLVQIARDRGAWISAKANILPQPGDFVLVGGDKVRDGGVEHVFTVISAESDDSGGIILTSIDGGQRDGKGQQAIFEKTRRWTWRNGSYWDVSAQGSDPGSNAPGGRRVIGWGDIEKILQVDGIV